MKTYTVKEVATLSEITVRTLHHYDDIGLLKPAFIGKNQYRYYGEKELLRLQQILFYREFGVPLLQIAKLLDAPGFDLIAALNEHRARLVAETRRNRQLIRTIDRTIGKLNGDRTMEQSDLYRGFSIEQQAEYESWLIERHGDEMRLEVEASKKHLNKMPSAEQERNMVELQEVETALAAQMTQGAAPDSVSLDDLLSRHRAWVATMWGRECPADAYAGLAELYLSHPDFRERYETIAAGFAEYLPAAMRAYSARQAT